MTMLDAYHFWLQDRGQIWPILARKADKADDASKERFATASQSRLKVGFVCKTNTLQESELLHKMLAAMRLPTEEYKLAGELGELAAEQPQILVLLSEESEHIGQTEVGGWHIDDTPWGTVATLVTYHPLALLRAPKLKRMAWAHLQSVLERLLRL